jgi:hypothetical protein
MSSLSDTRASFGRTERILAILFGLGFIIGFLLTPLGFETRMNEIRTLAFGGYFIIVGLLLPLAGLVMLFIRPGFAGFLAITDAALLFLTAPADQAKFFFTVAPPPAVTAGEYLLILVGIAYMWYGQRVYLEHRTHRVT